jgi:AcrR family transcriptional regulator
MTETVKRPRPYRSRHRLEQARQTRLRILEAAREIFVRKGFSGTTIAAVAKAAEASEETIYSIFSNKQGLLDALIRKAVIGESEAPLVDQPGPVAVRSSTSQREQIQLFAADVAERLKRTAPLVQTLKSAAMGDLELDALYRALQRDRKKGLSSFTDALERNGKLTVSNAEANETVWAIASPELYTLLTETAELTHAAYKIWLVDILVKLLLPAK